MDGALVRRLVDSQFPAWSSLPLVPLDGSGTSHSVFRLGADLVVRLPRLAAAEQQVAREARWLPTLAEHLAGLARVPEPMAVGEPQHGYPFRWLVSGWVPGIDLLERPEHVDDPRAFATDLAAAIRQLRTIDLPAPPAAGKRGQALGPHDAAVRENLASIDRATDPTDSIDIVAALDRWDEALAAEPHRGPPVWLHGDLLPGNVVVRDGRFHGLIDWSATGVGDPACDLMIAWDLPPDARDAYLSAMAADEAEIARARGWVVEQAAAFIPYYAQTLPAAVATTAARLAAAIAR